MQAETGDRLVKLLEQARHEGPGVGHLDADAALVDGRGQAECSTDLLRHPLGVAGRGDDDDVTADARLQLVGGAQGDDAAAVDDRDPLGIGVTDSMRRGSATKITGDAM